MQKLINQEISSLDMFKRQECILTIRNTGGFAFYTYVNDIVNMDGEIMFEVQLRNGFIKMLPFSEIVQIELLNDLDKNLKYLYGANTIEK